MIRLYDQSGSSNFGPQRLWVKVHCFKLRLNDRKKNVHIFTLFNRSSSTVSIRTSQRVDFLSKSQSSGCLYPHIPSISRWHRIRSLIILKCLFPVLNDKAKFRFWNEIFFLPSTGLSWLRYLKFKIWIRSWVWHTSWKYVRRSTCAKFENSIDRDVQ